MAVKIKLMRLGKMRAPYYRIVVADARTKRDGRSIETIGKYHPKEDPSFIEVDGERVRYWLGVGALPTDAVAAILKVTGDWQAFKGLPAPPPMLVAEPKVDKKAVFEAAAREGIDGSGAGAATTAKKKAAPKAVASDDTAPAGHAAPPAEATATPAAAEQAAAEPPAAESAAAEPAAAEPAAAEPATSDAAPAESAAPAPDAPAADETAASPEGDAAPDVAAVAPDADKA